MFNFRGKNRLEKGYDKAEELIKDKDKMERFLQKLEKKLARVPVVGSKLSSVPVLASLLRSYVRKEYRELPIGSVVAIASALLYFVSPIDFLPDLLPAIGYADDAAVITACLSLIDSDVEDYKRWREANGKKLV